MAEGKTDPERGDRVERLMDAQGWGVSHLARVIGCERSQIYNWKAGKPIASDSLERLAVALETTRLYIQTGEGPMHYPRGDTPALLLKQLADSLEEQEPPRD